MAETGGARPYRAEGAAMAIDDLPERGRVVVSGIIDSVTYPPSSDVAAFTAIVSDPGVSRRADRKKLQVVWLGRRRVPGLAAGTRIKLEGMLTRNDGKPAMFNPRYEILSNQERE